MFFLFEIFFTYNDVYPKQDFSKNSAIKIGKNKNDNNARNSNSTNFYNYLLHWWKNLKPKQTEANLEKRQATLNLVYILTRFTKDMPICSDFRLAQCNYSVE